MLHFYKLQMYTNMKKIVLALLPALLIGTAYAQDKAENEDNAKKACTLTDKIWYISPIKFTENGVGFELGYEHGIDAGGIVAYNLPVVATFNMAKNDLDNGNKQDPMYYVMPGIKFYPASSHGKVRYAIGPSIVAGFGSRTENDRVEVYPNVYPPYYYPTYTDNYVTKNKFVLGVMINNSLNINPSPHFTLGLDLGLGFSYINQLDGTNKGMTTLVQGGFKMGYRL